jgi:monofunctional biosynthetic peptidoglycan transglycosylase
MKPSGKWLIYLLAGFLALTVTPVIALRWLPLPTSSVILQRTLLEGTAQHYHWTRLDRIAPSMALAVVAAEDQKFPEHHGFDVTAIRAALSRNARGGPLHGASTISQQVARNLFLWQGRSWLRKGLETWMTILLETFWPKWRILEVYLNIAETGPRTFGVEMAARRYLGTTAARLSAPEAALIAAVLPNPARMHIDRPSAYVLERRNEILQQMDMLGSAYLGAILRQTRH